MNERFERVIIIMGWCLNASKFMSKFQIIFLSLCIFFIVVGLILFSRTMFNWSLEWVGDWWPMGLVALGAWLVYEDVMAKVRRAPKDAKGYESES